MNSTDVPSAVGGLNPPETAEGWLRPSIHWPAEPRWGHPDGLQVGLHPLTGPRGLLRVYAPYLGHPRERVINFVAVEPIAAGATERGFSELEPSDVDGSAGKCFWGTDSPEDATPRAADRPSRGVVEMVDGVEHLRVFIGVEPFANGADVYLRVSFRADRPHEIGLAAYRRPTSVQLEHCVLTATMGNFARLRHLQLADRTVAPDQLWPGFAGDAFTEHARFGLPELVRTTAGDALVQATGDEVEPARAAYAPDTREHWKYVGRRAVQGWRVPSPHPQLQALVNGRHAYWASTSPIPGGTSFENLEVIEPFRDGRELVFSVEPLG